jgi:hypothetical protein
MEGTLFSNGFGNDALAAGLKVNGKASPVMTRPASVANLRVSVKLM